MEYNNAANHFIGIGDKSNIEAAECEWEIVVFGAGHHQSDEQLNAANGKSTTNLIRYQTNHEYGCVRSSSMDFGTKFRSNQMFSFQKVIKWNWAALLATKLDLIQNFFFHFCSLALLFEVNLAPSVNKMLSNCDDIIRQHKAACLRVTSLLACKDLIWIGTSAGVILTIPAASCKSSGSVSTFSSVLDQPIVTGA